MRSEAQAMRNESWNWTICLLLASDSCLCTSVFTSQYTGITGPTMQMIFLRSMEMGVVWKHIRLLCYCFQLQMEQQFTLTEGVIINHTPTCTVTPGHFTISSCRCFNFAVGLVSSMSDILTMFDSLTLVNKIEWELCLCLWNVSLRFTACLSLYHTHFTSHLLIKTDSEFVSHDVIVLFTVFKHHQEILAILASGVTITWVRLVGF